MIRLMPNISLLTKTGRFLFCGQKPPVPKPQVKQLTPKDFSGIDIRVGEIIESWKHPESQNLYCQKIKILNTPETILNIASGLRKYVQPENMKGKVVVMVNLKTRKLAGFESQGMVVCATSHDKTQCEMLVPENSEIGQRVVLQNCNQLYQAIPVDKFLSTLSPKKKLLERALEDLRTDQQGFVVWKNIKLMTKNGYLKSQLKNAKVY